MVFKLWFLFFIFNYLISFPVLSSREFLWFVFLFCFEDSLKRQTIALAISWSAAFIYFCNLIGYPPLLYLLVTHWFLKTFFLVSKQILAYLSTIVLHTPKKKIEKWKIKSILYFTAQKKKKKKRIVNVTHQAFIFMPVVFPL